MSGIVGFIAILYIVVGPLVTILFQITYIHITLTIVAIGIYVLCMLGNVDAILKEINPGNKLDNKEAIHEAYTFMCNFFFFAQMFYILYSPLFYFAGAPQSS